MADALQDDLATSVGFARGQQRALELIASGAPLEEVLEFIIRTIETFAPGMRGSVLLLPDGTHVRHGAAPSLPPEYVALIDGMAIGPTAGSCGTAMYDDRRVIVADIANDPLWEAYRAAALPFGLRACWSTPLHATGGQVIGSFAMYYDTSREPTARDLELADVASHLCGLAIESSWSADQLRRRAKEQTAVAAIGRQALEYGDEQTLMETIAATVADTLDGAAVALIEHTESGDPRVRAAVDWPPGNVAPGERCVFVDVPARGSRWGILSVEARGERELTQEELLFLRSIVNVLAAALARALREEEISQQALHDPLTELPNRALLVSLLEHSLQRTRLSGGKVGVLLLDVDNFKLVNDSFGHGAGDALLASIARRLRDNVHEIDTVARFHGDEFVVVAEDLRNEMEAVRLAERITELMTAPFDLNGDGHVATLSIGVAVDDGEGTPEALLRDADSAMYRAKEMGGAAHRIFDEGMRERTLARLRLAGAMRVAIQRSELTLHYQPIVAIGGWMPGSSSLSVDGAGPVVGAEALLRWPNPPDGSVGATEMVEAAEATRLIEPVGAWVLERALGDRARWPDSAHYAWISVNVSARQIGGDSLITAVAAALAASGVPPHRLVLELTETALVEDEKASLDTLEALRALGVRIALDDFGMGFSSLRRVLRYPIDLIKIDRSFVFDLPESSRARAIIAAVVAMAHELGKTVIAEGVEKEEQLASALELGCDYAQGFLTGRPAPLENLVSMLGQ